MFWVPQPGRVGMGVSIISYAGEAVVGLATDAGLVTDPDAIIAAFHDEFESIQEQVGAVSSSRKASEAAPKHEPPAARGHPGQCQALTQSGRRCKNRAMPGSTTCRLHQGSAV